MSETARAPHPLVGSIEEILLAKGLNVPEQYATTQPSQQIEQTYAPKLAPPEPDRFASITIEQLENAPLLGTAGAQARTAALEAEAGANTTPARRFDFPTLSPAHYVRTAAVRMATSGAQEKVEKGSKFVRAAIVVGSLAAAATTVAATVYGARHGIHIGPIDIGGTNNSGNRTEWHNNGPTWHDAPSTSGPETQITGPGPNHLSPDAGQQPTTGIEAPTPKPEHHDTYQTAVSYDKDTGRASNVTDWSRETIYKEALDAGLTKSQATTLSHDQGNIHDVNNAFYHGNRSVGQDNDHTIFAGEKYKMTDSEVKADHIIGQFKAEHHIKPAVEAPAADTHLGNTGQQPAPHTSTQSETAPSASAKVQTAESPAAATASPTYEAQAVEQPSFIAEHGYSLAEHRLLVGATAGVLVTGAATAVLGGHAVYVGRRADAAAQQSMHEINSRRTQQRAQQEAVLALAKISTTTAEVGQQHTAEETSSTPSHSHRVSKDKKPTFPSKKEKRRTGRQRRKGVRAINSLAKG